MWTKKDFFDNYQIGDNDLGGFRNGLIRAIDLIENPDKIPKINFFPEREILRVDALPPKQERDGVIVRNFKKGLSNLTRVYYFAHDDTSEKYDMRVHAVFKDGANFLSLHIAYLRHIFELRFSSKDNNSYTAKIIESELKFAEIMRRHIGESEEKTFHLL